MKILSIEIGTDITHVIETDYKVKNPKVYAYFSFFTPVGMIGDGLVKKNEEFKKRLNKALSVHKIKTRKALFVVTSGKIANRDVEIPFVRENRIRDLLNANSAEYFPVDLAQYQLVYRIISAPQLEKDKRRKLFVLAVPNELVRSYEQLSTYCSLELISMEYTGNSMFQTMRRAVRESRSLAVKLDENAAMITIIRHGEVEIQRTIFYGISEAETLVAESGLFADKDYQSVGEIMTNEYCMNTHLDENSQDADEKVRELKDEVTEAMRPLIGNIGRVVDYYLSRNTGVEIKECTILGNAAQVKGLKQLLENELGMHISVLSSEQSKIIGLPKDMPIAEYIVCYGAVMAPLEFTFGQKQDEEIAKAKKKKEMIAAKGFGAVCLLVSVGMIGFGLAQHIVLKTYVNKLSDQKSELAYIQDIYDTYTTTKTEYADVVAMSDTTVTTSQQLADVIDELEQKLPSNVSVSSLTSDGTGVTLNVTVSSKKEAAKLLEELQTFETFREVKTDGVTEITDEDGITVVSLSVTCTYVNGEEDTEVSTETTIEEDVEPYDSGEQDVTPDIGKDNSDSSQEGDENE